MNEFEKIYNEIKLLAKRIDNECGDIPCYGCPLSKEVKIFVEKEYISKSICSLMYAMK